MNIRIKFQKYGAMKFIGHLDIMRYFQKAIRRAEIDIAYTGGYSPHQVMSFAAPLGVGVTSSGEYFDIEVNSTRSSRESVDALNREMVEGITVLEYRKLPDAAKTSMSLVAAADYFAYEKPGYGPLFASREGLSGKIQQFYQGQKEIIITKQTKKSLIEMDLKPLIYQMQAVSLTGMHSPEFSPSAGFGISLRTCTGSSDNVKPELVLASFCKFCGLDFQPFQFQIHRQEVYARTEDIPVKGEQEQKKYQQYLRQLQKSYAREGKAFPEFRPLGELGEDIP